MKRKSTEKTSSVEKLTKVAKKADYLETDDKSSFFQRFIGNELTVEKFFDEYWEKRPFVFKRNGDDDWLNYVKTLFSLEQLRTIVKDGKKNQVTYAKDLNLCSFINGQKKGLDKIIKNAKGFVKLDELNRAFDKEKATIQFHQPQRFSDELWSLLERLECFFGCLVGSNVYITPSQSQGLAPHYDDIEAFVIQLEGTKEWRLYYPTLELPNECSKDLNEKDIGRPTHTFVLQPGDMIYFPRGIIHQAYTPKSAEHNSYSTHITISTYQNFNKTEFMSSVFENALRSSFNECLEMRQGLPIGFLKQLNFKELLENSLKNVKFNEQSCFPTDLIKDFMSERLPPLKTEEESVDLSKLKLVNDLKDNLELKLTNPDHVLISLDYDDALDESDEEDEEEEEEEPKPLESSSEKKLFVFYSHLNDRSSHMVSKEKPQTNCLKLDPQCYEMMRLLMKSDKNSWIKLKDLKVHFEKEKSALLKDSLTSLFVENIIHFK